MKLHDLKPNAGKKRSRKRVGRGISAGQGKTAGRGMKGQGARAGGGTSLYHQGGNLPFFRRLPFKRGFTPFNRIDYNEINIDQLDVERFPTDSDVSVESLIGANLLRNPKNPIVILGRGELDRALNFQVHRVTKGAREKIESAGGSISIVERK